MSELKPCPFCGETPRIIEHEYTDVDNTYGIKCKCGTQGFQFWETIDDAIEAWNRRKTEPQAEVYDYKGNGKWERSE